MSVIVWVYALLLRLYPHRFRAEFGEEMRAVFAEAVASRTGLASIVIVCLRELKDLPTSLLREHWSEILKGIAMAENRQTGSWKDATLAGLPHLLVVMLVLLPLGTVRNGSTVYPIFLFILPFFILAALALAWRRGWPRWAASWYIYAAVIVLLLPQIVLLAAPLIIVGWLYWITGRDRIKGLLMATPLMLLFWSPALEFVEPTIHNAIQLGMVLLAGALAIAIVRLNNARIGLWLALDASLLTGLLAAYARTYWHNLPPEYSEPPTLAAMAGLFAPQLVVGSALVIGPLLFWGLREIGKRSGQAGMLGYRLALGGLVLNLFGNLGYYLGYFWQSIANIGPGTLWFNMVVYLGLFLCLAGALWLGVAVRRSKVPLDLASLALLVLIPSALPLMWMLLLPIWFGFRILPAGLSVALYDLGDIYKYEVYAVGLVWLLLGGWLVTRLSAMPPGPASA
ncbi:MAG: hypothetical protein HYZ49_12590 [Chloroflexi bacterium]|nr:hypothetical protein [Chloroflexota bacterium]